MHELQIDFEGLVNTDALHAELTRLVGERFTGISTGDGALRVHLTDTPDEAIEAQIRAAIQKHDPARLTPGQQQRADRAARVQALARKAWADFTPQDKDELLQMVAAALGLIGGNDESEDVVHAGNPGGTDGVGRDSLGAERGAESDTGAGDR